MRVGSVLLFVFLLALSACNKQGVNGNASIYFGNKPGETEPPTRPSFGDQEIPADLLAREELWGKTYYELGASECVDKEGTTKTEAYSSAIEFTADKKNILKKQNPCSEQELLEDLNLEISFDSELLAHKEKQTVLEKRETVPSFTSPDSRPIEAWCLFQEYSNWDVRIRPPSPSQPNYRFEMWADYGAPQGWRRVLYPRVVERIETPEHIFYAATEQIDVMSLFSLLVFKRVSAFPDGLYDSILGYGGDAQYIIENAANFNQPRCRVSSLPSS